MFTTKLRWQNHLLSIFVFGQDDCFDTVKQNANKKLAILSTLEWNHLRTHTVSFPLFLAHIVSNILRDPYKN